MDLEILINKAQELNKRLQRGDRKEIANRLGVSYTSVWASLHKPKGTDLDFSVFSLARGIIEKREKSFKKF